MRRHAMQPTLEVFEGRQMLSTVHPVVGPIRNQTVVTPSSALQGGVGNDTLTTVSLHTMIQKPGHVTIRLSEFHDSIQKPGH